MRTDYLEQAGLTIDDFTDLTWTEFMEKGKQVTEACGQPMLTSQAGSPDLIMEMLQSCGASLFNEDGSVNIEGNEALKECLEIYAQMVADGTLVEVTDWDQYIASLNNGTVVSSINGCWIMASIVAQEDQSENGRSPICRDWKNRRTLPTTPTTAVPPGLFPELPRTKIWPSIS